LDKLHRKFNSQGTICYYAVKEGRKEKKKERKKERKEGKKGRKKDGRKE
jgi:hypothetical protein